MSNLFNCCKKEKLDSMDKLHPHKKETVRRGHNHGYIPISYPFSSESEEKNDLAVQGTKNQKKKPPPIVIKVQKPLRLKNYLGLEENTDTLHSHVGEIPAITTKCSEKLCQGSIIDIPNRGDVPRTTEETYEEAEYFLREYYESIKRENTPSHVNRLKEVRDELAQTGTYQLKTTELVFGAKLAWRNASRCIGRIQWKKLQMFDCREVTTASGMFEALCTHIKYGTNKGNIRSAITVFPQRTDGKHDYRIWNSQLIGYAGYRQPDNTIIGDPMRVEFTELCIKLGWKPPYTPWDILPLVLSADGKDPEFFDIPQEIVMQVELEHPTYHWFKELGMRWYALPAVANMRFDCGGLEFTASAFNGWYMSTEIGCRNLCDANRFYILQNVAEKMGLDTNANITLWKDKAVVEVNIAVLHSYQKNNVSMVDHHTASEQFMKHFSTENRTRGGCPSDWVWIVPPMSSSLTPVWHQEMARYYIRPSYDYQVPAWITHKWQDAEGKPVRRKFHFKQIARAVKFTSHLFSRALSKRIKATILYATETGKSEGYATELGTIFGQAFNAQVHRMSDYDMFSIEHETLLLVVTSTFGNGEPPANGVEFGEHLYGMLHNEQQHQGGKESNDLSPGLALHTPKSLMRANSMLSPGVEWRSRKPLSRLESTKSSVGGASTADENLGPLSNVRFAVFGLGSSAYPKFCNFAKNMDKVLGDLGGERLLDIGTGDELLGQEQQFHEWASEIFHVACETFCIDDTEFAQTVKNKLNTLPLTEATVRFGKPDSMPLSLKAAFEKAYKNELIECTVRENKLLTTDEHQTIFINMEPNEEITYEPGDHLGVMAYNRKEIVDAVLAKFIDVKDYDKTFQLQTMKETLTPLGTTKTWVSHNHLPQLTVREMFSRFLDITTPPSAKVLQYLASKCTNKNDEQKLMKIAADSNEYNEWRHFYYPHLAEIFEMFPSCQPQGSLLAALLPSLQPRFYSISSSPLTEGNNIHLTVAIVTYKTEDGKGPTHYGVCSTYLQASGVGDELIVFLRKASNFHMPKNTSVPLILVGPGTGVAPFRGFWRHRKQQMLASPGLKFGEIWFFFGCRDLALDLYKEEKADAVAKGILTKALTAFSREKSVSQKHVQDLLEEQGSEVCRLLVEERGHFYVCGDCKMAENVMQKLKGIIQKHAKMTEEEVSKFFLTVTDENRYHEDIFGIVCRTAEVQKESRETAKKIRLNSLTSK